MVLLPGPCVFQLIHGAARPFDRPGTRFGSARRPVGHFQVNEIAPARAAPRSTLFRPGTRLAAPQSPKDNPARPLSSSAGKSVVLPNWAVGGMLCRCHMRAIELGAAL
jgi:hypothetical protein